MARLLLFLPLVTLLALTLLLRPGFLPRLLGRLWYFLGYRGVQGAQVPQWVSYYVWAAPGDPVPRGVQRLEEMLQAAGAILLAPLVLLLIILLFSS